MELLENIKIIKKLRFRVCSLQCCILADVNSDQNVKSFDSKTVLWLVPNFQGVLLYSSHSFVINS